MEKKERMRYRAGFKEQVIQRMREGERVKALSHEFLIAPSVLFTWRQESEERPGGRKHEKVQRQRDGEVQALEVRIAELEAAVGRSMLERDFWQVPCEESG